MIQSRVLVTCLSVLTLLVMGCHQGSGDGIRSGNPGKSSPPMRVAHLGQPGTPGFKSLSKAFEQRNAGYQLLYLPSTKTLPATKTSRVVFVQSGPSMGRLIDGQSNALSVGDIVLVRPGESISFDPAIDLVVFTLPNRFDQSLPTWVRPDWDERITDTPGGCATDPGAYRRLLLTWMPERGPYINHDLNAHRVRIDDSFTHYHPLDGGFDEFYLVQDVRPGAKLITSRYTGRIEAACGTGALVEIEPGALLDVQVLEVGDLVYLPRGLAHRGVDGVVAQVIAVPGFRPNAEIGLDHCLRAINENAGLTEEAALPHNQEASGAAVVK